MQEGGDTKEYTGEDVEEGQQELVGDVATDPSKAIEKPEVVKVDPDKTGTEYNRRCRSGRLLQHHKAKHQL